MKKRLKYGLVIGSVLFGSYGCVSVKSYQKMQLNDKNMALTDKKIESFEINYEAYREGASGGNGGKVGGGCGCN
ncbi:MAG: DUF4266 domain-containing protein [Bacteroidia bacterium]|nr:DUF4266 domain-containing protein [Bacteroidia bacterium]